MPSFDGYAEIIQDLTDRSEWELRQSQWYRMRHNGLRRRYKPYLGAADMHFPLIDALIERLKAFYFSQLYATDTLASFVSLRLQDNEVTTSCGGWMDYRLKQRSNFERAILSAVDHMLLSGFCPIKLFWDPKKKRIRFAPVSPINLIVPKYTLDFDDAPRVTNVIKMSVADYKRNPEFNQDAAFINLIKGKSSGAGSGGQSEALDQERLNRSGLTVGQTDQEIVIWEVEERTASGIRVQTYSPLQPDENKYIRKPFYLPYELGPFKDHDAYNYVMLQMEVKDEGWYSSRGIAEINASFETSLCKMWNQKHDWMDFFNRPTYKATRDIGNVSNIRQMPGQILPPGVEPNVTPAPPVSFDEEMQSTRALSEYRTSIPDLGASSHFGQRPGYGNEKPTATQINAIVGQSGMADDMRVRVFRMALGDAYCKSWALYLENDKDDLIFVVRDQVSQVAQAALHDAYLIKPNGSADSWNKGLMMQKAIVRMQTLQGNAYTDQGELVKSYLELDDPGLVKRLYRDPGTQMQNQATKQSVETLLILSHFAAPVDPSDDDKTHLSSLGQFGTQRMKEQQPIDALSAQLFSQHINGHMQALQQKKDKAYNQFRQLMAPFLQILSQIAPTNVVQMPGAAATPPGMDGGQGQGMLGVGGGQSKPPDPESDAAKLLTAFAAMAKAGQPVHTEQINAVLETVGIPPIVLASNMGAMQQSG